MSQRPPSTSRLEAFSDGVIAVIITIMVLELKVPQANGPAGLRAVLPTLLTYALSFVFTGIYWINHHHLVHRTETADQRILYSNLFFLFCLSLLPFFTAFVLETHFDGFSVAVYAASLVLTGFGFLLLRFAIDSQVRRSSTLEREAQLATRKHIVSLGLYLLAVPLAFGHPLLAMGEISLVTLAWVLPDLFLVSPHHGSAERAAQLDA